MLISTFRLNMPLVSGPTFLFLIRPPISQQSSRSTSTRVRQSSQNLIHNLSITLPRKQMQVSVIDLTNEDSSSDDEEL